MSNKAWALKNFLKRGVYCLIVVGISIYILEHLVLMCTPAKYLLNKLSKFMPKSKFKIKTNP